MAHEQVGDVLEEALKAAALTEEDARTWVDSLKETDGVFAFPTGVLIARGAYEHGADAATAKATRVLLWWMVERQKRRLAEYREGLASGTIESIGPLFTMGSIETAQAFIDSLSQELESLGISKPEEA